MKTSMLFQLSTASCKVVPMKFNAKKALAALKKAGYPKATVVMKKPKPETSS
ncbi:MAG: hypothetical protein IH991_08685 [Planctomycetes bacterium]|nr:hypothetical protein [Planctomycetota bacterium]